MISAGSSPRSRGTPRGIAHPLAAERLIPTPVGNTFATTRTGDPPVGSSPHSWGTPATPAPRRLRSRFIPTPVGNACRPPAPGRSPSVHPHARGEHMWKCKFGSQDIGSSPRPRGTQRECVVGGDYLRFIPTSVGNTSRPSSLRSPRSVHPRAPWGTQRIAVVRRDQLRFIPTGVGNTLSTTRMGIRRSVHPHAHGEHADRVDAFLRPPQRW